MNGCLKGALRLGCAVVILGALVLAWWFREPIMSTAARWFGRSTALPPVADTAVGAPTPKAIASGQAKVGNLRTSAGPDSVVLTPNEMASLIGGGIDWNVRKMYDSLRVELQEGKLILHARLDTRALPPGTLGPFASMFGEHEPLRMGGTVSIARPGTALYDITEVSLRGFEIPGPFVKQLTKQMAGASSNGGVPVKVDPAVTDVKVHTTGVVLYKRPPRKAP
ncbi:MAG TPA: hypothetical protein VEK77_06095 [Gemmatimonadales bacterium]|nr:hypothetical protein [Gemmatimonadales bacterium]HYU27807.1 hypothetical protein [Gemmatimonadales bacterium]